MPTFYSDAARLQIDDLFPGWIMTADVSSVTAIGGGGKGLMSADYMARRSQGWPNPPYLPDDPAVDYEQVLAACEILHVTLEDSVERTMGFRLDAAGADDTKIAYLDQLELPADFGKLRSEINNLTNCGLVVIDPWMAAATSTTAYNQQLRHKLLNPLIHTARDTGVGIWILNHFTKGTNGGRLAANSTKSLTDYVAGSAGFTQTLRMNTVIVDSPNDPKIKQWKHLKSNGGGGEPLEYTIVASRPNDPDAHIEWRQPPPDPNDQRMFDRLCARVLGELVAADRPMTPQAMCKLVNMSFALTDRALKALVHTGQAQKRRGAFTVPPAITAATPPPIAVVPWSAPTTPQPITGPGSRLWTP